MTLENLIDRLGLVEVARRAGVTVATLRRWLRYRPSKQGAETLRRVIRRHLASRAAAATRKKRKEFPGSLPLPPEAFAVISPRPFPGSGYLSEEEVLPVESPVQTKADFNRARKQAGYTGSKRVNTDAYSGEWNWITIGQSMLDVDPERIGAQVVEIWRHSRRTLCDVRFLSFRYVPFNPLYKGEMVNKQGKWFDWWTGTGIHGEARTIQDAVEVALGYQVSAAYNRVIWLEAMGVRTMDHKQDLPTAEQTMGRTIR